jgi:hypothetical protein
VGVREKALAHAHRQEWNAALFDKLTDQVVALRVSRALAQNNQRLFADEAGLNWPQGPSLEP